MAAYHGEKFGFYFAWLVHYTSALIIPAAVGLAFFILQIYYGVQAYQVNKLLPEDHPEWRTTSELLFHQMDEKYSQIFAIVIIVWSTLVTESWKRKQNTLADKWLMRDFFDATLEKPQFRPKFEIDPDRQAVVRKPQRSSYLRFLLLGLPVTIAFMAAVAYCVMHTRVAYDNWQDKQIKKGKEIPFFASFIPSTA